MSNEKSEPLELQKQESFNPSAQEKRLSKDDLLPYFQSKKASESKHDREESESQSKNLVNPSPAGSYLSASIFSYNPLNLFGGFNHGGGESDSKNQSPNLQPSKVKSIIQDKLLDEEDTLPTDFANLEDAGLDEEEEDQNEGEESSSSNLFHAFQRAHTIFSKPLFNPTMKTPLKTNAYGGFYQVPSNASAYYN